MAVYIVRYGVHLIVKANQNIGVSLTIGPVVLSSSMYKALKGQKLRLHFGAGSFLAALYDPYGNDPIAYLYPSFQKEMLQMMGKSWEGWG